MKILSKIATLAVPSFVLGGLLLYSPFGQADDRVSPRSAPPARAAGPMRAAGGPQSGVYIDGKRMDGAQIRAKVRAGLDSARQALASAPMPPEMRAKVQARLDKVGAIVDRRLAKVDFSNLERLGDQLEGLDDEIEAAMAGMDQEIEAMVEASFKSLDFSKLAELEKLKALGDLDLRFGHDGDDGDDDDDDDGGWGFSTAPQPPTPPAPPAPPNGIAPPAPPAPPSPPGRGGLSFDVEIDDSDIASADLQLRGDQRASLRAVRAETDAKVRPAREQLDRLSSQLESLLRDPSASADQVNALVDRISAQEASIRKARINAWLKSRALLDARQRARLGQP